MYVCMYVCKDETHCKILHKLMIEIIPLCHRSVKCTTHHKQQLSLVNCTDIKTALVLVYIQSYVQQLDYISADKNAVNQVDQNETTQKYTHDKFGNVCHKDLCTKMFTREYCQPVNTKFV